MSVDERYQCRTCGNHRVHCYCANGDEPEPPPPPVDDGDERARRPLTVITFAAFAAVEEQGSDALLGDGSDALIPANGDVMMYGNGGAGKTTLSNDLACHLATGTDWLGITVPRPVTVLLIENEGPRPLFRMKARRKVDAWTGPPVERLHIVEDPWAAFTFASENDRAELARQIAEHQVDVVVIGPLVAAGMNDAGTLQEVRAFIGLCNDVRLRGGRPVTFILIHHENKGGKVSGAWEGAGDTLLHVRGLGQGATRVYVQKARWSSTWHGRTLDLLWTEGEGFKVDEEPDVSDEDLAEHITQAVAENPGTGWKRLEDATTGVRSARKRTIRDRLLSAGVLVNIVKDDGVEVALNHCPERRPCRLYLADDPAIAHLCPGRDTDGTQTVSAGARAGNASVSLCPVVRDTGRDTDTDGAPLSLLMDTEADL